MYFINISLFEPKTPDPVPVISNLATRDEIISAVTIGNRFTNIWPDFSNVDAVLVNSNLESILAQQKQWDLDLSAACTRENGIIKCGH